MSLALRAGITVVLFTATLLGLAFAFTKRPPPPRVEEEVHVLRKADRMPIAPRVIPLGPPTATELAPAPQPATPSPSSLPSSAEGRGRSPARNICERTGGRKVEYNRGRSWRCQYDHRRRRRG